MLGFIMFDQGLERLGDQPRSGRLVMHVTTRSGTGVDHDLSKRACATLTSYNEREWLGTMVAWLRLPVLDVCKLLLCDYGGSKNVHGCAVDAAPLLSRSIQVLALRLI